MFEELLIIQETGMVLNPDEVGNRETDKEIVIKTYHKEKASQV